MIKQLIDMNEFILKNFTVIKSPHLNDKKALQYINEHNDKAIFIESKNENIWFISNINKEHVNYLPVPVITLHSDLNLIFEQLKNNYIVLLIDENEQYIGYLDAKHSFNLIAKNFNYLNAFTNTILKTIDESCTVIDHNKRVLFWTNGAEKIFSVKAENIIGKKITDFFEREHLEILKTLKNGKSVKNKKHHARDDLIVMINSNPVYLDDKIIGAVVSETDVTNIIRLNNELYEASKRLYNLEKEINNTEQDPFKDILGNSPKINKTKKLLKRASLTDANILIYGESGVGKELFAKAMHNLREASSAPFIPINCGAIPESLFESEIFGYEKGAFSGADQRGKKGKVELAKNGTLFLDEIGEMPLDMQVKLLRLLQEKKFYRVGGTKEISINFRVIAATNKDLKQLVEDGKFREDLYYRLNVVELEIPPLRERPEDIIELTHYYLHEYSIRYNRPIHGITQQIMQALLKYHWPGNIRELKNVIERLVVFSDDGNLKADILPFYDQYKDHLLNDEIVIESSNTNTREPLKQQLEKYEREIIIRELDKVNGNKKECAKNLGITRATLYNRMNRLGLKL